MSLCDVLSSFLYSQRILRYGESNGSSVNYKKLFDPKALHVVDEVRKCPKARNPIGSCFKNGLHSANLIYPQENPLRHVLYHKLPLARSILKFFFLRELPQLVFGPGQSGSQFGVHYDNLDPPTGSSWKGSQLNSGDPEHKTSYPWKLHDSIESKSMIIQWKSRKPLTWGFPSFEFFSCREASTELP